MAANKRGRRLGPLYSLLFAGLPEFRKPEPARRLHCAALADALGITEQALYQWFRENNLPPKRIYQLLKLKGSALAVDDLFKFTNSERKTRKDRYESSTKYEIERQ